MSRVIVHRSLPPLKKVLRTFSHFPAGKSHQMVMAEELRSAAEILRSTNPQPFYSMREVAEFFRAPLSNVARVYKILEGEGIINRIRSSQTMLAGRRTIARQPMRGIVGIPVLMECITNLIYTQNFSMQLGEHLQRSGYVANIIFYTKKEEESDPEFATRLLKHRLDAVIFHSPLASCRQNILFLRERGVRVFVIQRKEVRRDLPAVIYLEDQEAGYQKMATQWFKAGIRKVWLWSPHTRSYYHEKGNILHAILKGQGLDIELVQDEPRQFLKRIRRRASTSTTAVISTDRIHYEEICKLEPEIIEQISQFARLAFLEMIDLGPYLHPRVRVDLVEFSATEMAARLAADIRRLSILPDGVCHTFVPHFHEQIQL